MSEYFEVNPDPIAEGCSVTGLHEPGVVFPEIDIFGRTACFVGRTALLEAAAKVLGVTPDDVAAIESHVPRIKQLESELTVTRDVRDRFGAIVESLRDTFAAHFPTDPPPTAEPYGDESDWAVTPDVPTPKKTPKSTRKTRPPAPADLE